MKGLWGIIIKTTHHNMDLPSKQWPGVFVCLLEEKAGWECGSSALCIGRASSRCDLFSAHQALQPKIKVIYKLFITKLILIIKILTLLMSYG